MIEWLDGFDKRVKGIRELINFRMEWIVCFANALQMVNDSLVNDSLVVLGLFRNF